MTEVAWADHAAQLEFFVKSPVLLGRAVLPGMQARRYGRVVHIDSEVAHRPPPGRSAYAAAKNAQIGLTRSWAGELAPFGITVNTVAPGFIPVERHADIPDELRRAYLASVPAGRWQPPPTRPRGELPRLRRRRLCHRPAHRGRRRRKPRPDHACDSFPCLRRSVRLRKGEPRCQASSPRRSGGAGRRPGWPWPGRGRHPTTSRGGTSRPNRARSTTWRPRRAASPCGWCRREAERTGYSSASTAGASSAARYTRTARCSAIWPRRPARGRSWSATGCCPKAAAIRSRWTRARPPTAGCSSRAPSPAASRSPAIPSAAGWRSPCSSAPAPGASRRLRGPAHVARQRPGGQRRIV